MENGVRKALSKVAARTLYYFNTRDLHAISYSMPGDQPAYMHVSSELKISIEVISLVMPALQIRGLLESYKAGESTFVDVTGYGITKEGLDLLKKHGDNEEKLLEELGDMMKMFSFNISPYAREELDIPLEDAIPASD